MPRTGWLLALPSLPKAKLGVLSLKRASDRPPRKKKAPYRRVGASAIDVPLLPVHASD